MKWPTITMYPLKQLAWSHCQSVSQVSQLGSRWLTIQTYNVTKNQQHAAALNLQRPYLHRIGAAKEKPPSRKHQQSSDNLIDKQGTVHAANILSARKPRVSFQASKCGDP